MSGGAAIDNQKIEKWVVEFFESNPGASTNACLKAMNNARVPPVSWLVKRVHLAHVAKKLTSMMTLPAKDSGPGGAQPISPAHEEEEPMPPPAAPRPVAALLPPSVEVLEHRAKEKAAITTAARHLLAQMRLIGCDSCTLTIVDDGDKPLTDYKVTFR